jgi:hypothetical protein
VDFFDDTITYDVHGPITDIISPTSILIGNDTVVDLNIDLEYSNPADLSAANYEFVMDYLKDKLIGKEVYVRNDYAFYDLNGAMNSVTLNRMIQKEITYRIDCQW